MVAYTKRQDFLNIMWGEKNNQTNQHEICNDSLAQFEVCTTPVPRKNKQPKPPQQQQNSFSYPSTKKAVKYRTKNSYGIR